MSKETLTYDIETVPQENLSEIQQDELDKKFKRYMNKHPEADEQEAKNLLMGTSPYLGEIICIGLHKRERNGEQGSTCLVGDEKEMLKSFWDNIRGYKGGFVSYNGLDFDVPFIVKRSMAHGIKPTCNNFLDTYKFKHYPHFDCKNVISDFDRWSAPTLRMACDLFGIPSPKEGSVEAKDVAQAYKDGRIDEIADYCERDVIATFKLYTHLQGYYYQKKKKY